MKTGTYRFRAFLFLAVLLSGIIIYGCGKDDDVVDEITPEYDAPELPPEGSFVVDFSNIGDANDTVKKKGFSTYQNFGWSAWNVGVWNVIITVGLAVPVSSFQAAISQTPIWDNDLKAWIWSYTFTTDNNQSFTANLRGKIISGECDWEMYITKTGVYTDFLWYTGTSKTDRTGAEWTLYESPTNAVELLSIVWEKTSTEVANITYTNIKAGGAENGGYITYGTADDTTYNAYYNIYNKGQDNLTSINWHLTSKDGKVSDYNRFKDSLWHCWDETYVDIDCP